MQELSLPRILTIKEVAEYFRIREETVLGEIEEGRLEGFRIGNEWRLTEEQLAEFVNRNHRSVSRGRENRPSVQ
ncbi:MAG: helix-turn-helix domain-containing protein, partial [Dehalococcoidia bacterium]